MFDWLYNAFMSFVAYILSFFGMSMDKKVHFEDGSKEDDHVDPAAVAENVVRVLNGPDDALTQ